MYYYGGYLPTAKLSIIPHSYDVLYYYYINNLSIIRYPNLLLFIIVTSLLSVTSINNKYFITYPILPLNEYFIVLFVIVLLGRRV